jgi:predicted nucleic acid-binding protein
MIDLDANFLVKIVREEDSPRLVRWSSTPQEINISAVAWAEFLCGPLKSGHLSEARRLIDKIEPLTDADAELAAQLFNATGRRRRSMPDCMVTATAIRRGAALATLNIRDFRPFERFGLRLTQ